MVLMMENKPTTRIINIIMAGLFIIIAITLVTIAGSFYTVEQNAKKKRPGTTDAHLELCDEQPEACHRKQVLSLQQFSHELTSDNPPEVPSAKPTAK